MTHAAIPKLSTRNKRSATEESSTELSSSLPQDAALPSAPGLSASPAALRRFFAADGFLSRALPQGGRSFEERVEQREMAEAVARAVNEKHHLLAEAGTGTGKSYAYLIPLILWALSNQKRVLIATHTKALQQQLVERDLPFLKEMFLRRMGLEFRTALCLGAQNYICPRRLEKAEVGGLFASRDEVDELKEIRVFAKRSKTGRNLDLPFEVSPGVWSQVNRESDMCLGRACQKYDDSFFYKARREQERAHVLVANHHLLFAHLAAGGNESGAILPPFDALVIDEAHQAEEVAGAYLGLEFVNLGTARLIETLHNKRSGRTVFTGSTLPQAAELEKKLTEAADEAREATGIFFDNVLDALNWDGARSLTLRLRRPRMVTNVLDEPLNRLEGILREAKKRAESQGDEALIREFEGYSTRCEDSRENLNELLEQSRPGHVYWAQIQPRVGDGRAAQRVPRISLCAAPIEVAEGMQKTLFGAIKPVILTSATLTTGGNFEFLRERLGLVPDKCETAVETLTLGSPFNYQDNALLYVARDMPDPANAAAFEAAAVKRAAQVVQATNGRAFVLCTSFRTVDAAAIALRAELPKKIKVLKQGEGPRGKLLDEFRRDVNSVLVGTTSFWQGVDVPGESLSCVVMMKLPFAVPDDPLVQARVENLREQKRDAFNEYQVPQAVMMFRQGFGRLIRTRTDRGIVAVLDPRLVTKQYGQTFLKSLPDCTVVEELDALKEWFNVKDESKEIKDEK